MAKFKVYATKCFEIEVEASDPDQAADIALDIPLEKWDDPYELSELEVIIEELSENA